LRKIATEAGWESEGSNKGKPEVLRGMKKGNYVWNDLMGRK
jgi:hypothetical protein